MSKTLVNADCETCGHHMLRHGTGKGEGKCNGCQKKCEKYVFPTKE